MTTRWFRRRVFSAPPKVARPDPDYGTDLAPGADPIRLAPDADAVEERLAGSVERADQAKEAMEAALHPHEAGHIDLGGTASGFVRGVLVRVLARVVARAKRPLDPPR